MVVGGHEDRAPALAQSIVSRGVMACVLYSPPGRGPAALVRSGTALDASGAALWTSERTQTTRDLGRRRRNMRREA